MSFDVINTAVLQPAAVTVRSLNNNHSVQKQHPFSDRHPVQAKLEIGAPNDVFEKEADAVADTVMRMPAQNFVQRKCAECEKEEKLHRKPLNDSITHFVQTKSDATPVVSNATAQAIESSKGGGSKMDSNTESFMSSRFGNDFSNVHIHTDNEAVQLNRDLNARAFTVGNDIYFNEGEYQPQSATGKHLLAHELTHVVQQGRDVQMKLIQRGEKWDDFWGVGPWDSYKAYQIAQESLKAAQNTGLPGLHNGPADAWRHCYWNCRMAKEIGADQAETVSNNHEEDNPGPEIESTMDLHNNRVGFEDCLNDNCDDCCQGKLDAGKLFVIDETDPKKPNLIFSSKTKRAGGKQKSGGYSY